MNAADAGAPRPFRHLWLVRLAEWIRRSGHGADAAGPMPVRRIQHLLNVLDRNPSYRESVSALLRATLTDLDGQGLWTDFGFAPRSAFLSELSARLRRLYLPTSPDTADLGLLFRLVFSDAADAEWLTALDETTLQRVAALFRESPAQADVARWNRTVADAVRLLAGQIAASGSSALMRQRMTASPDAELPFRALFTAVGRLDRALEADGAVELTAAIAALRSALERCRLQTDSVYVHLNEFGISVDVIFEIHQLRERSYRIDALLATVEAPGSYRTLAQLLGAMIRADHGRKGIRALFAHHYSMLAEKVAQRSGAIGEHYITSTPREYFAMLRSALIGGAVVAATTFVKFLIFTLGFSPFWTGLAAGVNYAVSFMGIYLLHGVLATKQPAMTAPALAARLQRLGGGAEAAAPFVDEVAKLLRSQFAGIAGNLLAVTPLVLAIQFLVRLVSGAPAINAEKALHILHDNSLLGPTVLYAAFTGVILFLGSLLAGWSENWFIWHRMESAIAWNPRFVALLGSPRAQRWSRWWRQNISGVASNVGLGLMLGLVPSIGQFFGLPLEVRHVTLVTGQVAAAAGTLGLAVLFLPEFWWCVAAIPMIGLFNLGVSFTLAFRVALRSQGIEVRDRGRIARAVLSGINRRPGMFLFPTKTAA